MSSPLGAASDDGRVLPPGQHSRPDLPVRHYGPVPRRFPEPWPIAVGGELADRTLSTSLTELSELEPVTVVSDFHCASGWSVLDLAWTGVPARVLFELAPPPAGVTDVLVYGEYGYAANIAVADLLDGAALLATALNGVPLSKDHGAPVRLILPHLYCWKGPKWFRGWDYVTPEALGFWEARGYHRAGNVWEDQRHTLDGVPPDMAI